MKKTPKNRTLAQSFQDAGRGLWFCIRSERNMRLHTAVAGYVLFFAPFLGLSRGEYALLFLVIAAMITAEAFNTAIEKLCNFSCHEFDRRIGAVKDIAAGAVLVTAIGAVCVGVVLLWRPQAIWALLLGILGNSLWLFLFFLSALFAIVYVALGPAGIKLGMHRILRRNSKGK